MKNLRRYNNWMLRPLPMTLADIIRMTIRSLGRGRFVSYISGDIPWPVAPPRNPFAPHLDRRKD